MSLISIIILSAAALVAAYYWLFQGNSSSDLLSNPSVQRQIRQKAKLRERQEKSTGSKKKGSDERLPIGQYAAKTWIVLDLGLKIPAGKYKEPGTEAYQLSVRGVHGDNKSFSLADLDELGVEEFSSIDWHCVTGWTALDLGPFYGIPIARFLEAVQPRNDWVQLFQTSADGYTTGVAREDLEFTGAFFALYYQEPGKLIPFEHGGPRLVCPHLFGWKSAKYLTDIEFLPHQRNGFWENLGCHARGRVSLDERWAAPAHGIWTFLKGWTSSYQIFGYDIWVNVMQTGGRLLGAIMQRVQPSLRANT